MEYALYDLPSIHADNCGNAVLTPGWVHPERRISSSVLILGRRGRALIEDEGSVLEVAPGRLVLLAAARRHVGAAPIDAPASYYWIHFTAAPGALAMLGEDEAGTVLSNPAIRQHRLEEAALVPQSLDAKGDEAFAQYFQALSYEQESPSYTKLKYQSIFRELLIAITERVIAASGLRQPDTQLTSVVYAIVEEISAKLTDPDLSVKSIAACLKLNPDYLGRRFKEVMGVSIGAYILKKRVLLAQSKLELSRESVKEVAESCGFASMRHFLRQFKSECGMTPTEMRLHYQARHINNQ
jgi:AraC-type DNA-binding domain-containing proteins